MEIAHSLFALCLDDPQSTEQHTTQFIAHLITQPVLTQPSEDLHNLKQYAQTTLQQFNAALDTMSTTPLHPQLQSTYQCTTLMQVYLQEDKVHKWKDTCISQLSQLSEHLSQLDQQYKYWQQEFTPCSQEYQNCEPPDTDQLSLIDNDSLQQVICFLTALDTLKSKLKKVRQNWDYLVKPSKFVSSYDQIIKEIERRTMFNQTVQSKVDKLNQIVELENKSRKLFLQQVSDCIPSHFLPQLDHRSQTVEWSNQDDLPQIPTQGYVVKDYKSICIEQLHIIKSQFDDTLVQQVCEVNFKLVQELLKGTKHEYKAKLEQLERDLDKVQAELRRVIDDSQFTKQEHQQFISQVYKAHKQSQDTLSQDNHTLRQSLDHCIAECQVQKDKVSKLISQVDLLKTEKQGVVQQLQLQMAKSEDEYQQLKRVHQNKTVQYQCEQVKWSEMQAKLESEIKRLREVVQQKEDQVLELEGKLGEKRKKCSQLLADLSQKEQMCQQYDQLQSEYQHRVKELVQANDNYKLQQHKSQVENQTLVSNLRMMQKEFKMIAELVDRPKENKGQQTEQRSELVYEDVNEGDVCLFIPMESGEYAVLDIMTLSQSVSSKISKVTKDVKMVLRTDTQPYKLRQILDNFQVLVVGQVGRVEEGRCEATVFKLVIIESDCFQVYQF